jgi:hypothetical protein
MSIDPQVHQLPLPFNIKIKGRGMGMPLEKGNLPLKGRKGLIRQGFGRRGRI